MSKILAFGIGPLPFENQTKFYGSSIRTWHFVKPLLEQGHEICLIAMQLPDPYHELNLDKLIKRDITDIPSEAKPWIYYSVDELSVFRDLQFLQQVHDEFQPDGLLGINTHAAWMTGQIKSDKPFWADLNGYSMAEAQIKSFQMKDDKWVDYFWEQEKTIIHRADIFSTVSLPQKYALIGELATINRLNAATSNYDFVHHIPNSIENQEWQHTKTVLRGKDVTDSDFVILWSGSYNTWTNIEFLFNGLTKAMEINPRIKFVSTGGKIDGHDDTTYPRLVEMVNQSPLRDRFILKGWIPLEDVPNYYFETDLGLNIDGNNYEVVFGARNRLNSMMKAGLPILTSLGSEITYVLDKERLALTFPIGDVEKFANRILWAAEHREELKHMGLKSKHYIFDTWTFEKTTRSVQTWAKKPVHAPDWKL
jgi:glycosyltransferase involved in cell wall biosynthesis